MLDQKHAKMLHPHLFLDLYIPGVICEGGCGTHGRGGVRRIDLAGQVVRNGHFLLEAPDAQDSRLA